MGALSRNFGVTERGPPHATEALGGLATFFTLAYIVALNPILLSRARDATGARLPVAEVANSADQLARPLEGEEESRAAGPVSFETSNLVMPVAPARRRKLLSSWQ